MKGAPPASIVAAGAIVLAALAVYATGLDRAPYYVSADEAHFAAHAQALSERGTDLHGNRAPIFFRITDPLIPGHDQRVWYQPLLFYILAATFTVMPVTETGLRLPIALIGAGNVALMFIVARRLVRSSGIAAVAAGLLALTPAHFLFSRQAVDYLLPLPFVLLWLWLVLAYFERREPRLLIGAAMVLGAGVFSYIASWVVMPMLAALTVIAARPPLRHAASSVAAFSMPVAVVLLLHGDPGRVLGDMIGRYRLDGDAATGWLQTVLEFNVAERASLYWQYFNPSFLVFAGGADPLMATSRAGVFLVGTAALIALGVYVVLRGGDRARLMVLAGFVLAPLPVVLTVPETPAASPGRVLPMLVFGTLLAAIAAERLWQSPRALRKAALLILIAAVPLQFAVFRRDYFGDYQHRASHRFDPYAMRDAIAAIDDLESQQPASAVLLHDDGDNKAIRWRFYTLKEQRQELWERTSYFNVDAVSAAPEDALLVAGAGDPRFARLVDAGYLKVRQVRDISGRASVDLYRRTAAIAYAHPAAATIATNGAATRSRPGSIDLAIIMCGTGATARPDSSSHEGAVNGTISR